MKKALIFGLIGFLSAFVFVFIFYCIGSFLTWSLSKITLEDFRIVFLICFLVGLIGFFIGKSQGGKWNEWIE